LIVDAYKTALSSVIDEAPLFEQFALYHQSFRGTPLDLRDKPYMVELLVDLPRIEGADIRKCVQVGISELFMAFILRDAGWLGRIPAYVLPTAEIRDRFVSTRLFKLLESVPEYGAKGMPDAGNRKTIPFGAGRLFFLAARTNPDFLELSCDTAVIDEYDECVRLEPGTGNVAKVRDRLRASPRPQLFRVGNPDVPKEGIDKLYELGDQRRFYHRCGRCAELQPIDWFDSLVERTDSGAWVPRDPVARRDPSAPIRPICRRCREPFERGEPGARWVATNPERARRSYSMSRLDLLSEPVRDHFKEFVLAQASTMLLKVFWRGVLGRAYEPTGSAITSELLDACCVGPELDSMGGDSYGPLLVTAGIDVGSLLHVQISTVRSSSGNAEEDGSKPVRETRFVGVVVSFDDLAELLLRFRVDVAVIDANPETRAAKKLRDDFLARPDMPQIWLCEFSKTPRVDEQEYGLKLDHDVRRVLVDRTQVFDAAYDQVAAGPSRRILPADAPSVIGFFDQMKTPRRMLDSGGTRMIWTKGVDHFRLSDVYDLIAYDVAQSGGGYFEV
jgi:hypothetical protein